MKTHLLSIIRGECRIVKLGLALRMESKVVSCQNRAGEGDGTKFPPWHSDELAHLFQREKASAKQSQTFLLLPQTARNY